jgi:hypothetical protein
VGVTVMNIGGDGVTARMWEARRYARNLGLIRGAEKGYTRVTGQQSGGGAHLLQVLLR